MPRCDCCPHACELAPGQLGLCHSRRADERSVLPEAYGRITSLALDPIEKKPIARWRPGTTVLSLGSYGCNMRCPFCQNASIAHVGCNQVPWRQMRPEDLVEHALSLAKRNCIGLAYTYNEPLVNVEFLCDTAELAHKNGLANVLVSNGMASERTLKRLAGLIDAANIDLKCFTEAGYRRLGGNLEAVKRCIACFAADPACHLEVTTLVVPGISDDSAQLEDMAAWLASLNPNIPYHLSRFFPQYRMADAQPTPIKAMHRAQHLAEKHLRTVLLGNM